jgi:methionyl-tRNA formyltransferase
MEKLTRDKIGSYYLFKRRIKTKIKKYISLSPLVKIHTVYLKTLNAEVILKKREVPYWYVDDVNSGKFITKIKKTEPDLILCAGFPQIFSRELFSIPKYGAINIHPSLLPKFRGPSPFYWIIAKGETESGITAHLMSEKIDGGDIIAQIRFPISSMTYDELISKSIEETPEMIKQIHRFFSEGTQVPKKQDESKASYFRFVRERDRRIYWDQQDVQQIFNLVRTGRAICYFKNKKIGITACSISETVPESDKGIQADAGAAISASKDALTIRAIDGYICIHEALFKGRTMTAEKLSKRLNLQIGEKFT